MDNYLYDGFRKWIAYWYPKIIGECEKLKEVWEHIGTIMMIIVLPLVILEGVLIGFLCLTKLVLELPAERRTKDGTC